MHTTVASHQHLVIVPVNDPNPITINIMLKCSDSDHSINLGLNLQLKNQKWLINYLLFVLTGRSPFSFRHSTLPSSLGVAMSWNRGRSLSWGNHWCYGLSRLRFSGESPGLQYFFFLNKNRLCLLRLLYFME